VARILIIAYTTYAHDGRVKRQAEALSRRGDQVDVICLSSGPLSDTNGVTLLAIEIPRYRGASRARYVRSYFNFFARAAALATRRSLSARYDLVIVCTMPDAAILSALPCRLFGSRIVLDIHDTMPELYLDKFEGGRGRVGARLLMAGERISAWLADRVLAFMICMPRGCGRLAYRRTRSWSLPTVPIRASSNRAPTARQPSNATRPLPWSATVR
jgi:Glycosyl transferase 4-like domain